MKDVDHPKIALIFALLLFDAFFSSSILAFNAEKSPTIIDK